MCFTSAKSATSLSRANGHCCTTLVHSARLAMLWSMLRGCSLQLVPRLPALRVTLDASQPAPIDCWLTVGPGTR